MQRQCKEQNRKPRGRRCRSAGAGMAPTEACPRSGVRTRASCSVLTCDTNQDTYIPSHRTAAALRKSPCLHPSGRCTSVGLNSRAPPPPLLANEFSSNSEPRSKDEHDTLKRPALSFRAPVKVVMGLMQLRASVAQLRASACWSEMSAPSYHES